MSVSKVVTVYVGIRLSVPVLQAKKESAPDGAETWFNPQ